jgi:hypothetical protein
MFNFFGATKPKGKLNGHQTGSSLVLLGGLITYSKKTGVKFHLGGVFLVKTEWMWTIVVAVAAVVSTSLWWIFTHLTVIVNIFTG